MKKVPLKGGDFAIVDNKDYEEVILHSWTKLDSKYTSYAVMVEFDFSGRTIFCQSMHRFILGLSKGDGIVVDHKNHNGLDNRRCNIRKCTSSQNAMNQKPQGKSLISKYKGVSYSKKHKRWVSQLRSKNKTLYYAFFKNERAAAFAYNLAAKKHFGEFACLNKI